MSAPLLTVEDLVLDFRTRSGMVHVLDGISLSLARGEILGIVGESGSGKSVLAYAMMGLLDPAAQIPRGGIHFAGRNMLTESEQSLAEIRGREIAMIFQSPRTALNPIRRIGAQVQDVLLRHANISKKEARKRAIEALARVRIPDPERRFDAYPFELSGGLCQRVMIAMAMACDPFLLIADEPTTGLDVTTQAVVMDLIREQVRSANASVVLITHDLALAGEYCDRIAVMHAGHIVEIGTTEALLTTPKHPYTARLIGATPGGHARIEDLASIPGSLPDLRRDLPPCRFIARCDRRLERCAVENLPSVNFGPDHLVRCWNPL